MSIHNVFWLEGCGYPRPDEPDKGARVLEGFINLTRHLPPTLRAEDMVRSQNMMQDMMSPYTYLSLGMWEEE